MALPAILNPVLRAAWRVKVEERLHEIGARVLCTEAGAYRIAKGDSYIVTRDLAEVTPRDLDDLAKA